ncbi:peptidylprolyl isomerase [Flavicella sediminum]|uniref:peptidylprolyl isomerase n=1 Tax=Flavicella sediminum TaxID=2585141 RepID=UPI00111D0E24|nr:peptidylprolyl isomerase [Flavicella sediminum]
MKSNYFLHYLKVVVFLCFVVSCDSPPPKKLKKQNTFVKKKKVHKRIIYTTDTITTENCEEFFTEYGKKNKETKVLLSTRLGDMTIRLYENTPLHRASFIYLTKHNYFDTTCFYRVVPGFIVQGGNSDSDVTTEFRTQLNNYLLPAEFRKNRPHKRGVIAAARDWEYNPEKRSSSFEFYFIQSQRDQSHLNFEHTVFGEIIDGIEVIDKIAAEDIDTDEWPRNNIPMKIKVLN